MYGKMIVFGISVFLFGVSSAIDLSGCEPRQPKLIQVSQQLSGEVTNPSFYSNINYLDNLYCVFVIKAPYGLRLKLTFDFMDIEPADMCTRDAVEVLDSGGQTPRGLGVFCGNQTFPPIVSESNQVSVIFRTDDMIRRKGFRLRYQASSRPSVCNHLGQMPCRNGRCYYPMDACNGRDDCGDGSDEQGCGFPARVTECGVRKISVISSPDRVIGGQEAEPGSWPWQADLQLSFIHPNGHTCGGTLISSQWVLTAAHCFEQFRAPEAWRIHLGNHHKFITDSSEQIRYANRIILYPNSTGEALLHLPQIDMLNDLALVQLNAPVRLTDKVRPACLPKQGHELSLGAKCMATGWGTTRGTGGYDVLKEVDLTVKEAKICDGLMGPIKEDTMICVQNERGFQDVCHGDSGGPLVCEIDGKWNVMGATSFGSQGNFEGGLCALPESGTVYSKVSQKANWIAEQIGKYS